MSSATALVANDGVVLVGAGSLGRDALSVAHALGPDGVVRGFVDDREELWGSSVNGVPVLGGVDWLVEHAKGTRALLTVGSPAARRTLDEQLTAAGVEWATWVHPTAVLTPTVSVAEGALIMACVTTTIDVRIGRHVVVNPGCTLAHDVVLEDFAYLSPGVDLAGYAVLEIEAYMGTGAVVIPGCRVGARTTVGAGGVVIRDIPPDCTAVGVPARPRSTDSSSTTSTGS